MRPGPERISSIETIDLESPHAERRWAMYLQMKLRHYKCADCGTPCKTTSPNAVRCPKCGKAWEKERNRQLISGGDISG
jgi:DNA-directed RNA polymerase subunit RPC12/RpoP